MQDRSDNSSFGSAVQVVPARAEAGILLVCEHASNHIPKDLNNLGVSEDVLSSHVAWDPGALGVASAMSDLLQSPLVFGTISRLVYDCNRPPDAPSAMPTRSEIHDIPGNANLSQTDKDQRVAGIYHPFCSALGREIAQRRQALALMATIHSFNPVYHDQKRDVEIGILHGQDPRFAHKMMAHRPANPAWDARLNEPYSASDGVAHTLDLHGAANTLPNVMIEIRNDLIQSASQQDHMAQYLVDWIVTALTAQEVPS